MTSSALNAETRVEIVNEVLTAYSDGDAERFARHLAEDVVLRPSAFLSGISEYRGRDEATQGLVQAFRRLESERKRLRITVTETWCDRDDPSVVLNLGRIEIEREAGDRFGAPVAYLWRLRGSEVIDLKTWLDHDKAMERLGSPASVSNGAPAGSGDGSARPSRVPRLRRPRSLRR